MKQSSWAWWCSASISASLNARTDNVNFKLNLELSIVSPQFRAGKYKKSGGTDP
jgi:hypothetical protein